MREGTPKHQNAPLCTGYTFLNHLAHFNTVDRLSSEAWNHTIILFLNRDSCSCADDCALPYRGAQTPRTTPFLSLSYFPLVGGGPNIFFVILFRSFHVGEYGIVYRACPESNFQSLCVIIIQ